MDVSNPEPTPPNIILFEMLGGFAANRMIALAVKFDLADRIASGVTNADELARAIPAHPDALYRYLRALVTLGLLEEAEGRNFSLTPVGACLRTDVPDSLHALIRWAEEVEWVMWWNHFEACVRTGKSAFEHAYGMGMFDYFQHNPDKAALFDSAMTGFVSRNSATIVEAHPFAAPQKIVDVGGGLGSLMAAILMANPGTTGVIYDLPSVVDGARQQIESVGLADRCECVPGDFFSEIPMGGDVYLLVSILHDWDDDRCLTILKNCRRAMSDSARLLIVEMVIPPGTGPSFAKEFDTTMLVLTGGRERTEAEFQRLLVWAGFRIERVTPTDATVSIIEAAPAADLIQ